MEKNKKMEKQLKIAYIVTVFPQLSEAFFINQITDLIDKGHDVQVYASQKAVAPYHSKVLDYRLLSRTHFPPELPSPFLKKFLLLIWFLFKHGRIAERVVRFLMIKSSSTNWFTIFWLDTLCNNYDVIHAHFGNNGTTIADFKKAGLLTNIPLVTTFHGYDLHPSSGFFRGYERLIQIGDAYTVNSDYTRKIAIQQGFPEKRITLVPVGLDTELFKPIRKENNINGSVKILFVGRFIAFKAPDIFVRICKELYDRKIPFHAIMIGSGNLYPEIEAMIREFQLSDCIQLKGGLTQEDIIWAMDEMNIFLLPGIIDSSGRSENQGLVIQEAQAMKLPVIVSDAGGMREGMLDEVTGYVVNEKNVTGFADKIEHLFKTPALCEKMGNEGRKFVCDQYDSKYLNKQIENIYLKTLLSL